MSPQLAASYERPDHPRAHAELSGCLANAEIQQQQSAFGDMKDRQEREKQEQKPPPAGSTQKVGGQQEKKSAGEPPNAELAMPLQKLDQVRNQDSPAKLYRLMEGKQQQPKKPAKDW